MDRNPFQTLEVLRTKISDKFDTSLTKKTVSNYIRIIGFSKKRIVRRLYTKSLADHLLNRKKMKKRLKKIANSDIVSVDECSINGEIYAKLGYCKKNKRLICNIPNDKLPSRHSMIMAITNKGVLKYELHKNKAINTDIFYSFLEGMLETMDGKYILMDNVAFHKSQRIQDLIANSGNTLLFIPPYSPDFNPIEESFSSLKSFIRRHINPVTLNKDIYKLIKKYVKSVKSFEGIYRHAFG